MLELDGGGVTGDTFPIGAITGFAGETPPENWLICDGSEVSRTVYAKLFSAIGTAYGSGDGFTTFNLPDLRGKVGVGLDNRDNDFNTLGKTGGEKTHTLTVQEMPSHKHDMLWESGTGGESKSVLKWSGNQTTWQKVAVDSSGGNQPHNNLQPYVVTNYIIKAFQSSGVVANVAQAKTQSDTDTYSCNYINDRLDEINSGLTSVLSTAIGETKDITTPVTLLETTIAKAGVYLFTANIPINYYGQTGRELFCKLSINNSVKGMCGGVINTSAWVVYSQLMVIDNIPANSNIKITIEDASGKPYACTQFNMQYVRLK